jgi:hypothetical protein
MLNVVLFILIVECGRKPGSFLENHKLEMCIIRHWYLSKHVYDLCDIHSGVGKYWNSQLFYTVLNLFFEVTHNNIVMLLMYNL